MDTIETFEHNGHIITIHPDHDPMNPRTDWDQLGVWAAWHRRYDLGDKDHGIEWEEVPAIIKSQRVHGVPCVALPVYMIDHGSQAFSVSSYHCPWDSGLVGVIFATLEQCQRMGHKWKRWSPKRRKDVADWLKNEIEVYDQFQRGEVYGYTVTDPDGEQVASCWGFYGMDEVREAAKHDTPDAPTPIQTLQKRIDSIAA